MLPAPRHTPAAVGYLAVSTQAGSCGRLGAKAGLPPGIVPRPQLGRISRDSSAEGEEMGRGSLRCGGPWPGEAPSRCQGDPAPSSPMGESSGCSRVGVMGCRDMVGHRTPGWCRVAWAGLAGSGCHVCRTPTSAVCSGGDCAVPRLDWGNRHSRRARLSQGDTRPPHHAVGCDGPPHPTHSAGIADRAPLPQPTRSRVCLAPSWDFPPFK